MKYKQKAAKNYRTVLSGLSSCFVLNLRMTSESCLIFKKHSSKVASGISFFSVPTKDDECSINWRNNIVAVITCDNRYGDESNLKRQIKNSAF